MSEDRLQKIAAISLVIMPIFACYNLFGTSLAKFLMLFSCLFFLVWGKRRIVFPRFFKAFLIYSFTIPQIVAFLTGNTSQFLGSYVTLGIFAFNLCLIIPYLKLEIVTKYYRIVVIFTVVVFILQELSALVTGQRFSALIPFMTLYTNIPASQYASSLIYAPRSSSIFVEPSHYAQFLAPYLALSLYILDKKRKLFNLESIIVTLVFLIMRSGNGLILCAIIWASFFIFSSINKYKKIFIILPLAAFAGFYLVTAYLQTEKGAEVLKRQEELSSDYERTESSGTIRIYRGFFVQSEMGQVEKFLGVGQGGANDVIDHSSVSWMFFKEHYLNNASGFLISYGYIGTILFLLFIISLGKGTNKEIWMLILAFIGLCFIESFMCDSRMLLYVASICMLKYDGYIFGQRRKSTDLIQQYEENTVHSTGIIPSR